MNVRSPKLELQNAKHDGLVKHDEPVMLIHQTRSDLQARASLTVPVRARGKKPKEGWKKERWEKRSVRRVPTGVPGLDQLIEGGFKEKSIVLVEGAAGSGKSIFAAQFLVHGANKYQQPGVYVSFNESREDFFSNMARFGWDLEALEKKGLFSFVRYSPEQVQMVIKTGGGVVRDIIDKIHAKRIVIDSLSAFTLLYKEDLLRREAILSMFKLIKKWGETAVVVGEGLVNPDGGVSETMMYEVDGVVLLHYARKGVSRLRAAEVYKMRGTKHASRLLPMKITDKGIVIRGAHYVKK